MTNVIAGQTLLNNPPRERGHHLLALLATPLGALLALSNQHEVTGRFHVELLAFLQADGKLCRPGCRFRWRDDGLFFGESLQLQELKVALCGPSIYPLLP